MAIVSLATGVQTKAMLSKTRGFTLIEILIVIVIISIVSAVAVITIGYNQYKRVENIANQIASAMTLAEQQAMLEPAVLGFTLFPDSFEFYRFEVANNKWYPCTDNVLGKQSLPHDMQVTIQTVEDSDKKPQVIFSSSGEITPFTIFIGKVNDSPWYRIIGRANGFIKVERL